MNVTNLCESINCTTQVKISDAWLHGESGVERPGGARVGEERLVPKELLFNTDSLVSVVTYSVMFVVAAVGNVTVFSILFHNRKKGLSRVSVFILHLSGADLIVTFIMIPVEIAWHATVAWRAGDVACRLLMFCRTFGLYLSSFLLIGISLDRYFAVTRPLSLADAVKRGNMMIIFAWVASAVASVPQSVIFHVEQHPDYPWFSQCVTFNFFPSESHQLVYNLFNIALLYVIPLVVIVVCYSLMLREMARKTKTHKHECVADNGESLRRSGVGQMGRARVHTFKMTVVIVAVFIVCWTPYFLILALWWVDKGVAQKIDPKIQRGLFIFAVSNSCMNPIVYGMFTNVFRREVERRVQSFWRQLTGLWSRNNAQFRENQFEFYYFTNKNRQCF